MKSEALDRRQINKVHFFGDFRGFHPHGLYRRHWRPFPALREHRIDVVGHAGKDGLDGAVPAIADPATNVKAVRLFFCLPLEPTPLDAARDDDVNGFKQNVYGGVHLCVHRGHQRLFKFHDDLVNGQTVTGGGFDCADPAVAFGAEHVLHLHGFNDR